MAKRSKDRVRTMSRIELDLWNYKRTSVIGTRVHEV
jgi:hypothetical protein